MGLPLLTLGEDSARTDPLAAGRAEREPAHPDGVGP
jgi:hypothetical protein